MFRTRSKNKEPKKSHTTEMGKIENGGSGLTLHMITQSFHVIPMNARSVLSRVPIEKAKPKKAMEPSMRYAERTPKPHILRIP
ncbi:hypothetical protein KIN20_011822 [Parelaphostrongylus tenuis]|uniref:Uncharacterized protein n=1 Tax=Parelaphostrongylus tenuis TaxID=148309 RepID=A0AAD5MBD6_PARTN|nr:hypothetical protein KIN20_011822 [Parelaphostrongylus tenuis]